MTASEMTYCVSGGALNSTHSLMLQQNSDLADSTANVQALSGRACDAKRRLLLHSETLKESLLLHCLPANCFPKGLHAIILIEIFTYQLYSFAVSCPVNVACLSICLSACFV